MSVPRLVVQESRKISDVERSLWTYLQHGLINKTYKKILNVNSITVDDERYLDYDLVLKALDNGHIELAKFLIEKGLRVYKHRTSSEICERTILHTAIPSKDPDFIKTILEKGAAPNILSSDLKNQTPLHIAIDFCQLSIIRIFLSYFNVETFEEKYYLHYAIEKDIIPVVLMLVAKGFSTTKKNKKNLTPFCIAVKNWNSQILDVLLSSCNVKNIKSTKFNDIAPVYIASIWGNFKFIKKYVNFGLPVNIPLKLTVDSWSCLESYSGFTMLHCAVKSLELEVIKFLLSKGADISVKNKNRSTPLHDAFEARLMKFWDTWKDFEINDSIISMLLKANTKCKSNPVNKHELSHFHIACSRDDPTVVEHFLKLGASINKPVHPQCPSYEGFSPLHFTAKFRCKKTMELLLKNGADVNQKDSQQATALHIAAKEFCLDTIILLLQYGADVTATDVDKNTPIHWSFDNRNYEIIDLLLSVPNVTDSNPKNRNGVSIFHIACSRNNVKIVKSFIANGVSLNACVPKKSADWEGYSPLHFAVSHNRAKIVQLLLDEGAKVNIKDSDGCIPLHTACQYTSVMFMEFIKMTLKNASKKRGKTSLYFVPVISEIIYVHDDFFESNVFDGSIEKIDWSSNRIEHMKIINSLLNNGSDVNCMDHEGNTSLFYSYARVTDIKKDNLRNFPYCSRTIWFQIVESLSEELYERRKFIVRNLLTVGSNLEKCSRSGSILHYICNVPTEKSNHMMELFLKNGADVNARNMKDMQTPLHQAVWYLKTELVKMLLDYGANVDCIHLANNSTPLLIVASVPQRRRTQWYQNDIVKILIDKGANPNARLSRGNTALHILAYAGVCIYRYMYAYKALIITLIEAGADINSQDSNGLTVLHIACNYYNEYMIDVLLRYGADINIEDNKGRTVLCYLYEIHVQGVLTDLLFYNQPLIRIISLIQNHITKMHAIGFRVGSKTLLTNSKIARYKLTDESDEELLELEDCRTEVQKLRDTKIHANCTLYDVLFRNENELSHLVQNRTFHTILQSKSFEKYCIYGDIVQSKYWTGINRANLLPVAKYLLNSLTKLHLPHVCSENICQYFTNAELDESIRTLSPLFNLKKEHSDNNRQLRIRSTIKRPKLC